MSNLNDSINSILEHMKIDEVYHIDDFYVKEDSLDKDLVFSQFSKINSLIIQDLFDKNTRTFNNDSDIDLITLKEIWEDLDENDLNLIRNDIDDSFKWDNISSEIINNLFK